MSTLRLKEALRRTLAVACPVSPTCLQSLVLGFSSSILVAADMSPGPNVASGHASVIFNQEAQVRAGTITP